MPASAPSSFFSCLSAVLFGVGPGLYGANLPVQEGLREGSLGSGTGRKHARWRDALVIGEIGMTLALLIAAGLLIQTLWQLRHTNLGFAPEQLDTTSIFMPTHGAWWEGGDAKAPNIITGFYNPLEEQLRHSPGIQSVGMATIRPFTSSHFTLDAWPADQPEPPKKDIVGAAVRGSNADYFRTMGITITSGRGFLESDRPGGPLAVLVNQEFVRRILGGHNPLGTRLKWDDDDKKLTATIVGTIADIHQDSVRSAPSPELYFYLDQLTPGQDMYSILATFHMDIAVRTHLAPEAAFRVVRDAVHQLNPNLAFAEQTTMQEVVDTSLGRKPSPPACSASSASSLCLSPLPASTACSPTPSASAPASSAFASPSALSAKTFSGLSFATRSCCSQLEWPSASA